MIQRITVIALLALAAAGCHPANSSHLPMKQMEDVVLDITIAEAYSTKSADNVNFGGIKNMDSLAGFYKDVLQHHGITEQQFRESLQWYKAHPEEIDTLYAHLSDRADKMNSEESHRHKVVRPVPGTPAQPQPQQGPPLPPGKQQY